MSKRLQNTAAALYRCYVQMTRNQFHWFRHMVRGISAACSLRSQSIIYTFN